MNPKSRSPMPRPLVPDPLALAEALQRSVPLALLRQRLQESNARFAAIQALLPGGLARHVKAGPIDDESWCLLAANAAVAAKLRQLVPRLEQALLEGGWPVGAIRIRIQSD